MAGWSFSQRLTPIPVLLAACLLWGCADVTVHRVHAPDPVVAAAGPDDYPISQIADLADLPPALLLSLSEASFARGQRAEKHRPDDALPCFAESAACAYVLLARADTNDNTEQRAQTLYNAALTHYLRLAVETDRLKGAHQLDLPLSSGGLVPVVLIGFTRPATDFGKMKPCIDFRVHGLEHQFQAEGVGVPVAVRRPDDGPSPVHDYLPKGIIFAATAVLHFDAHRARATRLELVNSLTTSTAEINGRPVPLAADLTTPLACLVAERDILRMNFLGFLRADRLNDHMGIRIIDPYEPGKIPVLFVHGLLSSPVTWASLFNELRGDPFLREHFQFWTCYYPTGYPFLGSAAELRAALSRLRADLDPDHRDAAFEQMVLIGHSMGGLVSKLVTQEGGPDLWHAVSATRFDELNVSPALREKLRETFFFQRASGVTRVIFIATPHHGATLSQSVAGWLGAHLVHFRTDMEDFAKELAQRIPDFAYGHVPTSIELLAPDSPELRILTARPAPPGVHYHSVIGVEPKGWHLFGHAEPSDCVVTYRSAHLEGVESELVIPANHFTIHHHPDTVKEIRRILIEHQATSSRGPPGDFNSAPP
jgi:pimeloyl-ACP methyl ester carboxylesterase